MTTPAHANGHNAQPTPEQLMAEAVFVNYAQAKQQLAAATLLLSEMPLDALLAACKRHQSVSVLSAPPNLTGADLAAMKARLVADQRVIEAAIGLQRAFRAAGGM